MVGECERWKRGGYRQTGSTIYVQCSADCAQFAAGPAQTIIADFEKFALEEAKAAACAGKKRPASAVSVPSVQHTKKSKKKAKATKPSISLTPPMKQRK
jgi:hypothetical protein